MSFTRRLSLLSGRTTFRLIVGAVILVASVIAIANRLPGASPTSGGGDYPTYETVAELGAASNAVVHVLVGDGSTTFVDYGGEREEEGGGVSMLVQDVLVLATVSPLSESTLQVARLDPDAYEGVSTLRPGQEVILFLEHVTSADAPGIAVVTDELWVVVSGEEGVFDVVDGIAIPRANPDRVLAEGGSTLGSGADVAVLLSAASPDADRSP